MITYDVGFLLYIMYYVLLLGKKEANMTSEEFLHGVHKREIYDNYYIDNKGTIYSKRYKRPLKVQDSGQVCIIVNGKVKGVYPWIELAKAFPDVDIPKELGGCRKKRGVYPWKLGRKKWRAVIRYNGKAYSIGYYKEKEDAYNKFYVCYMAFRGHKPW